MNNKLYILQGPPASGKTTLAKKMNAENPEDSIIVSRDAFRHALGSYWQPTREHLITILETTAVEKGLQMGYDVILDATNLNPNFLKKWEDIANKNHVEVQYIKLEVSYEECVRRDMNEDREHHVGERVIKQFFNKYNL